MDIERQTFLKEIDKELGLITDKQRRETAMSWWNDLSSLAKTQLCDVNTNLVGSVRRWETLTGREIQMIYEKGYKV